MCFSGGGVRAASFDCGVLMKMGELGLLKEMDHLSAVSGGGYTASAYLTHLQYCDAPLPRGGKGADDWFRLRCCELVTRMQDNIGYLITCAHSQRRAPGKERGSKWARCCDTPAFVALLLGMPAANVVTGAAKGCENPNFKGSYFGRFPLVSADFSTSDHLSERSRT